jgi:uncharacterized membrane protein YczE
MPSLWQPTPRRLAALLVGLVAFGAGEACIVHAGLGNTPWTVLAQGLAGHTPLGIGAATGLISLVVLVAWIPLGQSLGLGTVLNAIVVSATIAGLLPLLAGHAAPVRVAYLAGGIALIAVGSGLYLAARLGPGPRDGLMTGLARRTGRSLRLIRGGIEGTALVAGFLLGGRVGVGTVAFAVLIGPGVQAALGLVEGRVADRARRRSGAPVVTEGPA